MVDSHCISFLFAVIAYPLKNSPFDIIDSHIWGLSPGRRVRSLKIKHNHLHTLKKEAEGLN